jgi:hypothetical protein
MWDICEEIYYEDEEKVIERYGKRSFGEDELVKLLLASKEA